MKKYLGVKLIQAEPETKGNKEGYKVVYPDGYVSWSPKDVFEKTYMNVGDYNTIEEHNVNDFIVSYETQKWGDKTTIVKATLANGFIIVESSSCVDPANYNEDVGSNICKEKIHNKVWAMLGFLLQCGVSGIKRNT